MKSVITAILFAFVTDVWSCSFKQFTKEFEVMRNAEAVSPAIPAFELSELVRGREGDHGSCDDAGILRLKNDTQYSEATGYKFRIVEGEFEDSLFPDYPLITLTASERANEYVFIWLDGGTHDQEPICITVEIIGVSLSGKESEPQILRIDDPGRKKRWWKFWK